MKIPATTNNTAMAVVRTGLHHYAIRDEDGEVMFDREQAALIILALQNIVRTGEVDGI